MAVSNGTSDGPKTAVDITVRLEKRLHAMRKKYTSPDGANGEVSDDGKGTQVADKNAPAAGGVLGAVEGAAAAVGAAAVSAAADATALSAEDIKKLKANNKAELHYLLRHASCIAFSAFALVIICMVVVPDGVWVRLGMQGPLNFVPTAVPTKTPPFATTTTTPDPDEASAKASAIMAIIGQQADEARAQEELAKTIAQAHTDNTAEVSSSMANAKSLQEKASKAWGARSALVKKWMQIKRSQIQPKESLTAAAPKAVAATGGLLILVLVVLVAAFAAVVQSPSIVALLGRPVAHGSPAGYQPLLG